MDSFISCGYHDTDGGGKPGDVGSYTDEWEGTITCNVNNGTTIPDGMGPWPPSMLENTFSYTDSNPGHLEIISNNYTSNPGITIARQYIQMFTTDIDVNVMYSISGGDSSGNICVNGSNNKAAFDLALGYTSAESITTPEMTLDYNFLLPALRFRTRNYRPLALCYVQPNGTIPTNSNFYAPFLNSAETTFVNQVSSTNIWNSSYKNISLIIVWEGMNTTFNTNFSFTLSYKISYECEYTIN